MPRQARSAPGKNGSPLGFEAQLWQTADALRNNMDAAEYKHVVLGLIFLKYISDAFEEQYVKLTSEKSQGADPEDRDEYRALNIFWVPKEARWPFLQGSAKQPTIGQIVDDALSAIERDNPTLKGVLPKDYARPNLDKARLGQLIDLIANIKVGDKESQSKDVLGRVYEYFLAKFASAEGKNAGQFYTPRQVVELLVNLIAPYRGRVFDPCCGSGGMFVQSERFVAAHANGNGNGGKAKSTISIYGQESNYTTWRLCKMNLAIRGIDGQIAHDDSFHEDGHPDLKADFILANPPFNDSDWRGELLQGDKRWKYGEPPPGNANFAWVQHFIHHLGPKGIAGFVLANRSLTTDRFGEGEIRRAIIDADLVDCIVALPSNLFYSTSIRVCLWIINRDKSARAKQRGHAGQTLFIDATELGTLVDKTHRELSEDEVSRVSDTYRAWLGDSKSAYQDMPGFCASVTNSALGNAGHVLMPGRFVGFQVDPIRVGHDPSVAVASLGETIATRAGLYKEVNDFTGRFAIKAPSSWVDSALGKIPHGWRVTSLGEVADVVDCLHSKKPDRLATGSPLLQVWNVSEDGLIDLSDPYYISREDYQAWTSRIEVKAGDCVITNVGRVGAVAQIPKGLTAAMGRNMTAIRCKSNFPYPTYLIEYLLSPGLRQEIDLQTDTGTVLDALNVKNIPKLRVLLPPDSALRQFEKDWRPLRRLMETSFAEAASIAQLRSALLNPIFAGRAVF